METQPVSNTLKMLSKCSPDMPASWLSHSSVNFQPHGIRKRQSRIARRHSGPCGGMIILRSDDGHLDLGCLPSDDVIVATQQARQDFWERAGVGAADGSVEEHRRVDPQAK